MLMEAMKVHEGLRPDFHLKAVTNGVQVICRAPYQGESSPQDTYVLTFEAVDEITGHRLKGTRLFTQAAVRTNASELAKKDKEKEAQAAFDAAVDVCNGIDKDDLARAELACRKFALVTVNEHGQNEHTYLKPAGAPAILQHQIGLQVRGNGK